MKTGLKQTEQKPFLYAQADIYFYKFKQFDTRKKHFFVYIELLV